MTSILVENGVRKRRYISPDDQPRPKPGWGWRDCPVCGNKITRNARGFWSHVRACWRKHGIAPYR